MTLSVCEGLYNTDDRKLEYTQKLGNSLVELVAERNPNGILQKDSLKS